jgi:hypothetical protein
MTDGPATGRLAVPQIFGSGALLFGIVENNTHGMPLAGTHSADAVTKVDPIAALGALHRAIMHGKMQRRRPAAAGRLRRGSACAAAVR